ncbi:hypothetical protein [Actinoplanes sp. RD1]|uniref:hypothetical protein n=1 Tax=Actinoplanes sp. RD1 TaxID=3064538 RepID=UPI0027415C44|nr:hypothetical protein [Actinoplanes sp. RD1]
MRRRIALAAVLAVGVALPAATVAGQAAYAKPRDSVSAPAKKKQTTAFAATGTVTAVDTTAGTVTLYAKGGTKNVRRQTVTVSVPEEAKIRVNGRKATLAAVAVGYRVEVAGRGDGTTWTAAVLAAKGKPAKPAPEVTPTPSPSVTPTPSPTTEPGDDDSGSSDD